MSTYETLKGLKVKFLSADTSGNRLQEGELFYNSSDFNLKSHVAVEAWSSAEVFAFEEASSLDWVFAFEVAFPFV